MSLVRAIEICPLASVKGGMAKFYTPQSSHNIALAQAVLAQHEYLVKA